MKAEQKKTYIAPQAGIVACECSSLIAASKVTGGGEDFGWGTRNECIWYLDDDDAYEEQWWEKESWY